MFFRFEKVLHSKKKSYFNYSLKASLEKQKLFFYSIVTYFLGLYMLILFYSLFIYFIFYILFYFGVCANNKMLFYFIFILFYLGVCANNKI